MIAHNCQSCGLRFYSQQARQLCLRCRDVAETGAQPKKQNPTPKTRSCLSCGKAFLSTWSGHRICKSCKNGHRSGLSKQFDEVVW